MPDRNEEPLSKIDSERPMPHNTTDFLGNPIRCWPAVGSGDGKAIACGRKRFMREAIAH